MPALLDKSRVEIKLGEYGVASATALADPALLPKVQEYRRLASARMMPLDREDISKRIPAAEYHVSRKVDGEFTALVFRDNQAFTINPGGTIRIGLPFLDEAAKLLSKAKVKEAIIAGELWVDRGPGGRPRVHDVTTVARQPQSSADLNKLRFAPFDIISLDGQPTAPAFADTFKTVERLFSGGEKIRPVESKVVKDVGAIQKLFEEWVEKEGSEGLVVRSDSAGSFKIKPRYTLDVAVIGFTESVGDRQGLLHDMLLAVMRQDGTLQVLSRVGGGFTDDQRREMLSDLKDMIVESEYAEVNGDHVAYQMVKPDWVIEISCLDLISQTTRGGSINRMVLDFANSSVNKYNVVTKLPLATVISPQFIRRREDKQVRPQDVRIAQVTDIVEVPLSDQNARQMTLPCSQVLAREVYTKDLKGQTMVRKFVLWQTNKAGDNDEFPAYVCHFTDFSPNRKDALSRDVRVSSSREQIEQLMKELKEENIKAGWNRAAGMLPGAGCEPAVLESQPPAETAETPAEKPKKKAAKKKAAAQEAAPPPADEASVIEPSQTKKKAARKKSG